MARPEFKPTKEQRLSVSVAAGGGMSHEDLATWLGIDRGTLEKHFAIELTQGALERRVEVLEAMHTAATEKGNVTAQRAYLERLPALGVPLPPPDPQPQPEKIGKKLQAQEDAKTAQRGTGWDDLLPRGPAGTVQ